MTWYGGLSCLHGTLVGKYCLVPAVVAFGVSCRPAVTQSLSPSYQDSMSMAGEPSQTPSEGARLLLEGMPSWEPSACLVPFPLRVSHQWWWW